MWQEGPFSPSPISSRLESWLALHCLLAPSRLIWQRQRQMQVLSFGPSEENSPSCSQEWACRRDVLPGSSLERATGQPASSPAPLTLPAFEVHIRPCLSLNEFWAPVPCSAVYSSSHILTPTWTRDAEIIFQTVRAPQFQFITLCYLNGCHGEGWRILNRSPKQAGRVSSEGQPPLRRMWGRGAILYIKRSSPGGEWNLTSPSFLCSHTPLL